MGICWVTLNVTNLEESIAFYKKFVNMTTYERFETNDNALIAMLGDADSVKLELIQWPEKTPIQKKSGITIGFEVESLEESIKLLENEGILILRGPIAPNHFVKFLFINDPDGHTIQLVEFKKVV